MPSLARSSSRTSPAPGAVEQQHPGGSHLLHPRNALVARRHVHRRANDRRHRGGMTIGNCPVYMSEIHERDLAATYRRPAGRPAGRVHRVGIHHRLVSRARLQLRHGKPPVAPQLHHRDRLQDPALRVAVLPARTAAVAGRDETARPRPSWSVCTGPGRIPRRRLPAGR